MASARRRLAAAFVLAVAAAVLAVNLAAHFWRVQGKPPPEYATWSGVIEVERKIGLLREFAAAGEVDALILSSSMGDLGISAEVLTRELTAHLGRPFRVFNFSMGGADLTTYPELYRLARLAARPREVWIVQPVSNPGDKIREGSLDEKLLKGPVGRYESVPFMLPLSYGFFQIPVVRNAPAIRDAGMYLRFANRPVSNLDLYDINPYGDTVSWLYNVPQYEHGTKLVVDRRREILGFAVAKSEADARKHSAIYFSNRSLAAIDEIKGLARRDGAAIRIVAHDMAVALGMRDAEYLDASRLWYEPLSRRLEAPVVDVRGAFALEPHMISDSVHLNTIGAVELSRLVAARIAGRPDPQPRRFVLPEKVRTRAPDPDWRLFTALLVKPEGAASRTLWLDYLQNWGVRYLGPTSNVAVVLRTPGQGEVVVPARVVSPGRVVADTSGLRSGPGDEVMTATLAYRNPRRLDPVDLPLASYRWSGERAQVDFQELRRSATVEPASDTFSAIEPIRVRWSGIDGPSTTDWVGVFPTSNPDAARVSYGHTRGGSSGSLALPPTFTAGEYELRLYRNDGPEVIATSKPFRIEGPRGTLSVGQAAVAPGGALDVAWKDINYPHAGHFIMLAPRGSKDVMALHRLMGRPEGSARLEVSAGVAPGEYEVRMYTSAWTLMAQVPVRVVAP
ncbi:MAG TPA: hypothetical protein VFK48_14325 [Usitatibacter sp.]|nr:hypothetical protein [Usitatibacter sp.]